MRHEESCAQRARQKAAHKRQARPGRRCEPGPAPLRAWPHRHEPIHPKRRPAAALPFAGPPRGPCRTLAARAWRLAQAAPPPYVTARRAFAPSRVARFTHPLLWLANTSMRPSRPRPDGRPNTGACSKWYKRLVPRSRSNHCLGSVAPKDAAHIASAASRQKTQPVASAASRQTQPESPNYTHTHCTRVAAPRMAQRPHRVSGPPSQAWQLPSSVSRHAPCLSRLGRIKRGPGREGPRHSHLGRIRHLLKHVQRLKAHGQQRLACAVDDLHAHAHVSASSSDRARARPHLPS